MAQGQDTRDQDKHDAEMSAIKGKAAYNAVQHGKDLKDIAKESGATAASNIHGTNIKNPLNL